MKVVFVYIDFGAGSHGKYYHGLASLSATLKAYGFDVSLVHVIDKIDANAIAAKIVEQAPALVAFSSTTNMWPHVAMTAMELRKISDVVTIAGGIHATIEPDEVIKTDGIDIACIGEGEYPLLELARSLMEGRDYRRIKNLWVKIDGVVIKNDQRELIADLDELAMPDQELFDYDTLEDAKQGRVVMMASRGCPYECAFCCNHLLKRIYQGKYVRFHSVDYIIREARALIARFNPEFIVFHDDILTLDKTWFKEFSRRYKEEIGLKFSCNSRVNLLDGEVIKLLAEAGCFEISMGVESGDPDIRETVLKRYMSNEDIIDAFKLCQRYGIRTISYNMVGLPHESFGQALSTARLNALAAPSNIQVSIFYPFPHTGLYEICRDEGLLTDKTAESYFQTPIISQPGITEAEVKFLFNEFPALVKAFTICYTLPKPIGRAADRLLAFLLKRRMFRLLFKWII